MDSAQADLFSLELAKGPPVGSWALTSRLGHGKSAVVMRGERNGEIAAVKVFHPGLIERYGIEAQKIRIDRERSLIGRQHDHIVKIIDGGTCQATNNLYVAMEYVHGRPLSSALNEIPRKQILILIEQLARAAKQLEDWQIIHRDIKPDNIHITIDLTRIKLLDFGVMKPIGNTAATDQQPSRGFIGTHQYSPPEMIHGREAETVDGWRAITFYQLGAVLHDLIVRKPLFADAANRTLAELVSAIDSADVRVEADDIAAGACNLATRCLLKNPDDRNSLVVWQDFFFSEHAHKRSLNSRARIEALTRRVRLGNVTMEDPLEQSEIVRLRKARLTTVARSVRTSFDKALGNLAGALPPRTTTHAGVQHPSPVLTCLFVADENKGFSEAFHAQLAVSFTEDSRVVSIYARAGRGIQTSELGWSHLGEFLDDFVNLELTLEVWILGVVEELLGQ